MDAAVNGSVDRGFEGVREAFVRNFKSRGERGAGLVVYRDGHRVVELYGGSRDVDGGGGAWRPGTAQVMRSATKGIAAAALLLLHQRGALDLDAPVGSYWPEFKAHGKEDARVRDVLAHRVGVPALDRPLSPAEAADPDLGAAAVAGQAPAWTPGTDHGYHAQTYSWLTAELVRRVTGGRGIGEYVADEIAGPAGADVWIGLPRERAGHVGRIGPTEPPAAPGGLRARPKKAIADAYADPGSLTRRAFGAIDPAPDENDPAYRAAQLPASNGIGTADGLARFYASLIGEVDGRARLFTPATVQLARTERSSGPDRVLIAPSRFGLGYMLHGAASPLLGPGSFGHPGRGGTLGFADPESGIAFGYVTNGMRKGVTADPRAQALVKAVREALERRSGE
ncbi:serine hydrolase domain-containing protein [Streptomyces beihaiensis]|uniref:Beta-lactamase family protein n=1 Tax=Streptomyces beihaiensis TaxID=2984495 RepID=A0ABT3TUB0_9ACTN|nr:serine hydrolase domain-containing protein [Streptomyces beihaiensis]MCX3060620.1 beta-lactamase family protein [Streptomyces beihaiensis]